MAAGHLAQASGRHLDRVAKVVIAERGGDHAQRVGLVAQCCRSWREDALARRAAPELHDLKFFLADSTPGQVGLPQ